MIKLVIVKREWRNLLTQPAFFFVLVCEICVAAVFLLGVRFETSNGHVLRIWALGIWIEEVGIFFHEVLPSLLRLGITFFLTLFVICTAGVFCDLQQNTIVKVVLASPIDRPSLLLSKFLGVLTFVSTDALLPVLVVYFAAYAKVGTTCPVDAMVASFLLFIEIASILSLGMLLGLVFSKESAVVVINLIYFLVLSPLLQNVESSRNELLRASTSILPPLYIMTEQINRAFLGLQYDVWPFLRGSLVSGLYVSLSIRLFNRKDL